MGGMPRTVAKRHHTVPVFYLRGFASDDQIGTVRLPGEHRFTQSVADAAVGRNFYAVEGHPHGADVVEKALSEVEGATAPILKKIEVGTWPLGPEDRTALGYFIALQATRVPAQRRTMDHLAAQLLRLQIGASGKAGLRQQLQRLGRELSDEELDSLWEATTRPEGPRIKRPKAAHIDQMLKLADEITKYILGRPWSLARFVRRSLITSDSPVGLVGDPDEEPWRGIGFMTAWGITFPLSRKLGLLMTNPEPLIQLGIPVAEVHRGRADTEQAGTTVLERFFNQHTIINASEWLFHHPDDHEFIPDELPEPRHVTVEMAGGPTEFTGEPWFKRPGDAPSND
jgi:hypothetical protein